MKTDTPTEQRIKNTTSYMTLNRSRMLLTTLVECDEDKGEYTPHHKHTVNELAWSDICVRNKGKTLINSKLCSFKSNDGINALFGPTGCGKTTLLKALSGRLNKSAGYDVSGVIFFNGKCMKREQVGTTIGYVNNRDKLCKYLTVRETLEQTLIVSLPSTVENDERSHKIDLLLNELDMADVQDQQIGTLSEEQRILIRIALEVLSNHKVILLDQPFTNFTTKTFKNILHYLDDVAKGGIVVVLSFAEPRSIVLRTCKNMLLLGNNGTNIYKGLTNGIIPYLERNGFIKPNMYSEADYIMEVVSNADEFQLTALTSTYTNSKSYKNIQGCIQDYVSTSVSTPIGIEGELKRTPSAFDIPGVVPANLKPEERKKYIYLQRFKQVYGISRRLVKGFIRQWDRIPANYISSLFFGLLIGLFFFDIHGDKNGTEELFNLILVFLCYPLLVSVTYSSWFKTDLRIYMREHIAGYYKRYILSFIANITPISLMTKVCYIEDSFNISIYITLICLMSLYSSFISTFLDISVIMKSEVATAINWLMYFFPPLLVYKGLISLLFSTLNISFIYTDQLINEKTIEISMTGNEYIKQMGIDVSLPFTTYIYILLAWIFINYILINVLLYHSCKQVIELSFNSVEQVKTLNAEYSNSDNIIVDDSIEVPDTLKSFQHIPNSFAKNPSPAYYEDDENEDFGLTIE
ncbi:hypothetical protein WA158_003712 [Blastocystis sp. Blastoise]